MRPRTSPTALAFLEEGFQHGSRGVRWARHLPEALRKFPGTEPNEPGAGQLEDMGRDLRLSASEGDDLRDRFPTLRHDDLFARFHPGQVLAETPLELGRWRALSARTPLVTWTRLLWSQKQ